MQVVVDSLLTHYEDEGAGKLIVLLHGWGDNSAGLAVLRTKLKEQYRVITPDLPGFGGTQAPPKPWGLDDYVAFIRHFLSKVQAGPVFALMGHSNGGAIIIRGLAEDQLAADRAVLLASAGIRNVQRGRKQALRILAKTAKAFTRPLPQTVRHKLRKRAYRQIGSDMLAVEGMQESFKLVVEQDVRSNAAQLTLPVLLIYGEEDDATPLWFAQQFHELMAYSTLVVLPQTGHFLHLEQPQKVVAVIKEFLK